MLIRFLLEHCMVVFFWFEWNENFSSSKKKSCQNLWIIWYLVSIGAGNQFSSGRKLVLLGVYYKYLIPLQEEFVRIVEKVSWTYFIPNFPWSKLTMCSILFPEASSNIPPDWWLPFCWAVSEEPDGVEDSFCDVPSCAMCTLNLDDNACCSPCSTWAANVASLGRFLLLPSDDDAWLDVEALNVAADISLSPWLFFGLLSQERHTVLDVSSVYSFWFSNFLYWQFPQLTLVWGIFTQKSCVHLTRLTCRRKRQNVRRQRGQNH